MPATGLAGGRALGSVDARQAPVRGTRARDVLERRAFRNHGRRRVERLKKRLRALVGRTAWMEPEGHVALAEQVGQSLAKAQLASAQRLAAGAALGAPACRGFKDVSHSPASSRPSLLGAPEQPRIADARGASGECSGRPLPAEFRHALEERRIGAQGREPLEE